MDDRCGCMREGGDMQCIHPAGHSELHEWGPLPARALVDEEDGADNEEGLQAVSEVPSDSGREVQE